MSKIATFSASIILTTSDEPEGDQIDLGPFVSNQPLPNTSVYPNGLANANTVSPGSSLTVSLSTSAFGNRQSSGPFTTPNVFAMYAAFLPLAETTGTLTAVGVSNDVGVQLSSANPSFIPVLPVESGQQTYLLMSTANTFAKIGWF